MRDKKSSRHITVHRINIEAWCSCDDKNISICVPVGLKRFRPRKLRSILGYAAKAVKDALYDQGGIIPARSFCCRLEDNPNPGTFGEYKMMANRRIISNGKSLKAYCK